MGIKANLVKNPNVLQKPVEKKAGIIMDINKNKCLQNPLIPVAKPPSNQIQGKGINANFKSTESLVKKTNEAINKLAVYKEVCWCVYYFFLRNLFFLLIFNLETRSEEITNSSSTKAY